MKDARTDPHRSAASLAGAAVSAWVLFSCLLVLNVLAVRPYCNWDTIAYIATVHAWDGGSAADVHERTYAEAAVGCPSLAAPRSGSAYQDAVAASPEALAQQLPFYTIKPTYPALVRILSAVGVQSVRATQLIALVGYIGVGVLVMLWLRSFFRPLAAALVGWLVMSLSFALDLARLATPDGLSTAVVLAALYFLFIRRRAVPGLGLLVGSIAIRPDNLFWLAAVCAYVVIMQPARRVHAMAAAVLGLGFYFGLVTWSGAYGWKTQFHHTFVERLVFPATFQPSLGLGDYVWIYLRETHPANQPLFVGLLVLLGACAAAHRLRKGVGSDPWTHLLLLTAVYMAARWLFWPEDDRLFAAAYLVIVLIAVRTAFDRGGDPASAG
jgi:hypothetical protein